MTLHLATGLDMFFWDFSDRGTAAYRVDTFHELFFEVYIVT